MTKRKLANAVRSICILVLMTACIAPAATPSTEPSAKPKHFVPPKTWQLVENKTFHFQFYIPPAWKQNQKSDATIAYVLPAPNGMPHDVFVIISGKGHPSTIEALANGARAQFEKGEKHEKIIKDESATLGDRPAWLFVLDSTQKMSQSVDGGPPEEISRHILSYKLLSIDKNAIFESSFDADPNQYDKEVGIIKKVLDTLTWTAPAEAEKS